MEWYWYAIIIACGMVFGYFKGLRNRYYSEYMVRRRREEAITKTREQRKRNVDY